VHLVGSYYESNALPSPQTTFCGDSFLAVENQGTWNTDLRILNHKISGDCYSKIDRNEDIRLNIFRFFHCSAAKLLKLT